MSPAPLPPAGRVAAGGARGLEIVPAAAAPGAAPGGLPPMRLVRGAPVPTERAALVANGTIVASAAAGVARSVRLPALAVVHDRRPPGLVGVIGAPLANACALLQGDRWSAVVLPSLGDIGTGPGTRVALRADGLAAVSWSGEGLVVHDLAREAEVVETRPGAVDAAAFDHRGDLVVAVGGEVGRPNGARGAGSVAVDLATAAEAPRALALGADGEVSLWDTATGGRIATWPSPVAGADTAALSANGLVASLASVSGDGAAALCEAETGRPLLVVEGATVLLPSPVDRGILVGGRWGLAWAAPIVDD